MRRGASWLLALVSLGLLALGLAWPLHLAFERGRVFARGSSLRSDAHGTRALFLLLEETGAAPRRLTLPAPTVERGLVLAIAPRPRPAGVQAELLAWVERGNTLLVAVVAPEEPRAGRSPEPRREDDDADDEPSEREKQSRKRSWRAPRAQTLETALGLEMGPAPSGGIEAPAPPGSPLAAVLAGEPAPRVARAFSSWPQRARILLGTPRAPALLELTWGGGRVLALSDASWLTNAGLPQGARLRIVQRLLSVPPGGALLFDEYRHDLAESPGLAYVLARYGLLPAAFALLLFLGLVVWATTPAEAPPALPADEAGEVRDSLVDTRAGLYARTLRPKDALDLLERDLRAGLSARLRAPGSDGGAAPGRLSWKDARRRLRELRPQSGPRVQQLLDEIERARRRPPPGLRPLLPLARRVARFLEEVR